MSIFLFWFGCITHRIIYRKFKRFIENPLSVPLFLKLFGCPNCIKSIYGNRLNKWIVTTTNNKILRSLILLGVIFWIRFDIFNYKTKNLFNNLYCLFFLMCIFYLRGKDTQRKRVSIPWFIFPKPLKSEAGPGQSRRWELSPGFLCRWQKPNYLSHHFCLLESAWAGSWS